MTDPTPYLIIGGSVLWFIITAFSVWLGHRSSKPPTDQQIAKYMNRVINQEQMEEHERITKFRMARNGRKTQRYDGGPNAKMRKMRIYQAARRYRGPKA